MSNKDNGVIQFTCEHCEISLTVDESLAGVSGPCPSCGKPTKSPDQKLRAGLRSDLRDERPRQEPARGPVDQGGGRGREFPGERPKKTARRVVSEARQEREEVAAVIRLLGLGLILLLLVLLAVYFGYQAFGS